MKTWCCTLSWTPNGDYIYIYILVYTGKTSEQTIKVQNGRCEAVNKWTPAIKIGMCQKFSDCCSPSDPQFGPFLDLNRSAQHCGKQFWPIPEDLNKGAETGSFLGYIKISRSWLVSKPGKQKMYRNVTQDLQWMTKWLSHVTLVPTFGHPDLGVQA